ncbi:MAG TPA: EamA/RhaT family transporter [Trueperaceae bacterium]|nr:EamA/RhaT family transporter [Trueperaceae bacterium]
MSGYLLVFIAAVLWAFIGVFSKAILEAGVSSMEIAFWRATIAGILFLIHAGVRKELKLQKKVDIPIFIAFALFGVTLFYASLILAIDAGSISLAYILLYSAPAWVVLLAFFLLKETITIKKLVLLAVALSGVVLVSLDKSDSIAVTPTAIFWGLVSGLSYASYYIFGKWILGRYKVITIYAFILPIGALGLLPFVHFSPKTPITYLYILAVAVLSTYLAYLVYFTGLKKIEASKAVMVATVEPVISAALAAIFFSEALGINGIIGGGLVLLASFLSLDFTKKP